MYKPLVEHSYRRSLDQNRLHAAKALVPKQEVIDRLQRYEASLERSFDRTLSAASSVFSVSAGGNRCYRPSRWMYLISSPA